MTALLALAFWLAPPSAAASFRDRVRAQKFLKGNLHAHSDAHEERSYDLGKGDGDASPARVISWYKGHGYDFAALTDHNELTPAAGALLGIELTASYGKPAKPVHVNALCVERDAKGRRAPADRDGAQTLRKTLEAGAASGARLLVVNHPTWEGGVTKAMLLATGAGAIEIASGHPAAQRDDAAASQSSEALWDALLAEGRDVWAVAADDSHDFRGKLQPGEPDLRAPGRAWVEVWAPSASAEDVCAALASGHFYASTGPALVELSVEGNELRVQVSGPWDPASDRVEFVTRRGVAAVSKDADARYLGDGSEGYVRARIVQGGQLAWTQAYRLQ